MPVQVTEVLHVKKQELISHCIYYKKIIFAFPKELLILLTLDKAKR